MITYRVATKLYLIQSRKEKIPIKSLRENEYGRHNHIQIRESITQEECISTPHVCYTQREPFS